MIGVLREELILLAPVRIPDQGGGFDIQYSVHDTVRTRSETRGSVFDNVGGRRAGGQTRLFTLRYRDDLVYEMRLEHTGRRYRITDIREEDDRKRYHFVTGEEVRP